jgi:RNA polymerase sigma-70 factor (ECF subfamily)
VDPLTRAAHRAGEGDGAALATFVRLSQPDVWRLCAHLIGRADADDLTQDVYLRAIPALPRFRGDSSARTWLLAIARRVAADHIGKLQRARRIDHAVAHARPLTATSDAGGRIALGMLVDALSNDRREAFVLTQILGLSYAEAAEVCECEIGTIRSRVSRARAELIDKANSATG